MFMSAHTQAAPHDAGQQAADMHDYRETLHELIGIGTGFARLLHAQAAAQAATQPPGRQPAAETQPVPAPAPDTLASLAAAFDRVARAVRRCIALSRSLAQPVPPTDPTRRRTAARKRILREVEDRIARRDGDGDGFGDPGTGLTAELHDRLDAPDLDDDIASRPVAEVITEICRDLGLASSPGDHPWKRRTPADLAQLHARAAAPSRAPNQGPGRITPGAAQHSPGGTFRSPPHSAAAPMPAQIQAPVAVDTPGDGGTTAAIPHHPACFRDRWRPPPYV